MGGYVKILEDGRMVEQDQTVSEPLGRLEADLWMQAEFGRHAAPAGEIARWTASWLPSEAG